MAEPPAGDQRHGLQAPGVGLAILAAVLFGASTPAAHWLLGSFPPVLLSALLYLGSGVGLAVPALLTVWWARRKPDPAAGGQAATPRAAATAVPAGPHGLLPLAAAIVLGGVLAPIAMLFGLQHTPASSAAVLLNLEGVATAGLAWLVFGEAVDASVASGMVCVVLAGALLAWPEGNAGTATGAATSAAATGTATSAAAVLHDGHLPPWLLPLRGPALLLLACLGWGLDNNLTRAVAHLDARTIAMAKGLAAGSCNLLLAAALAGGFGALALPLGAAGSTVALAALLGLLGYGVSLIAYVQAQARLGAARTGAWFGLSPFVGVAVALLVLKEPAPRLLAPACALLALGLWLHVRERHSHWHQHPPLQHQHSHRHDLHHQHAHDFAWNGAEPHVHPHQHPPLLHRHVHFPDLHHRHAHITAPDDGTANPSVLAPALLAAYRASRYEVEADPPLTLRIGEPNPALARLVLAEGFRAAAFLTPCNPLGERLDPVHNAGRLHSLQAALTAAGTRWYPGRGVGTDPAWPAEESCLILGLSRTETMLLARHWQQNAVVWADAGGLPHLLVLR